MFGSCFGEGWGSTEGSSDPFAPSSPEARSPQRPGASLGPPARVPLSFLGLCFGGGKKKVNCSGDVGLRRRGNPTAWPRVSFPFYCGGLHSEAGFLGLPGAPALPEQKRTKAGVHVAIMTQHLSRLQPQRCLFSQPRSLLPRKNTSFIFRFRAEPPSGPGVGAKARRGPVLGRAGLRRLMAAALLLLPPSFPGCRWEPGAGGGSAGLRPESQHGAAPRDEGWSRRQFLGPRARELRALSPAPLPPPGQAARRAPFRAPPAARAVAAAARRAGGGRREAVAAGGRGGRRVAARGQASTRVDAPGWGGLDGELGFRSRLGLRARLGGPPQARGGLARLLGRGCFSVSLPLGSLWPRATGPIRAPTPPEPAEASSAARTDPGPRRPYLAPKRSLRDERKGRRGPLFPLWV